MNIFITASNHEFSSARDVSVYFANHLGQFDKCVSYDVDTMIDEDFSNKNKEILSTKKGAGLWLWKPYFIHKALCEECEEGDVLFYVDAAAFFIGNVRKIIKNMENDIFAGQVPFTEEEFTKNETFETMELTEVKYRKTRQFQASFMAFRKSTRSVEFVKEWLSLCCNINLISDEFDFGIQIDNFVSHRMDQSIFSLLCKKYEIQPHQDPTQYGVLGYRPCFANTFLKIERKYEYPVVILLHRRKKVDWLWVIATFIWMHMPSFIICFRNKYVRHENR